MHRRAFLRGVAGSTTLGAVAAGLSGRPAAVGVAGAHPGPYRPFGSVAVENAREAVVDEDGEMAYVAADDGVVAVDVSPPHIPEVVAEERELLGDRETGPLHEIQDAKVEGDRLVAAGPANPKPGDVLQGFVLYDVSDFSGSERPEDPTLEQIGFYETDYPIHNCDIADGIVYLTANRSDRNELAVVDVRDDDPTELARWSLADRNDRWAELPRGLWTVHDVWVRGGRAYLSHWDAGVVVLDVSDPADPTLISRFAGRSLDDLASVPNEESRAEATRLPGNVHYAMTDEAGDLLALNREAWAVDGEGDPGGVELWDVSDETSPERRSTIDAPPTPNAERSGTWTTSHNLDLVDGRLFTSWYQGGVKIHDVSDPANPEEMAWWRAPGETAFWTAKRATSRFFVASNIGDYLGGVDGEAGLYTFPIERDEQKDPPPLTTAGENATDGAASGGGGDATTTDQAALAGETTATAEAESAGRAPGFGIASVVAALLGAGAWKVYRD